VTIAVRRLLAFCTIATIAGSACHGDESAIRIFGGLARVYHKPDSAITGTEIGSATGLELGVGLYARHLSLDLAYLGSGHEMKIGEEKVPLSFSSYTLRVGCDLTWRAKTIPFVTADYNRCRMTDRQGDGFKGGDALGVGAGLRFRPGQHSFIEVAIVYHFNNYNKFEVPSASWVNREYVRLNRLTIGIRMGGLIHFRPRAAEVTQ
jgi:hypothetical protein